MKTSTPTLPRLVIIGGGFAGSELAKSLRNKPIQVIVLDRQNYFTFQPLLYQVATAGLEPNSVAYPLRRLFHRANNIFFRLAEVQHIDLSKRCVATSLGQIDFDYLVIASGSQPRFFGLNPEYLIPLKNMPDALAFRNWVLGRCEQALVETDEERRQALLNFVIVGGGPTGVEFAGALAEMRRYVLPADYPDLNLEYLNIYLVEGLDRLLPGMSDKASVYAERYLRQMGVKIFLNTLIKNYQGRYVKLGEEEIPTGALIWTAGVEGAFPEGLSSDHFAKGRRLKVDEFNQVIGLNGVFAVGDAAMMVTPEYPEGHPMLAPVAIQQGKRLADNLLRFFSDQQMKPFRYQNRGYMATVGRNKAVADLPQGFFHGFPAWMAWMFIHLFWLIGFRNRVVVMVNWLYSYLTYDKALRVILNKPQERDSIHEFPLPTPGENGESEQITKARIPNLPVQKFSR